MQEYENMKINNVIFVKKAQKLNEWWEMVKNMFKEGMKVTFKKFKLDDNMYMHQLKAYLVAFPYFHYAPLTFNLEKLHGNPLNDKVGPSGKDSKKQI